jgi:hypothetical protein
MDNSGTSKRAGAKKAAAAAAAAAEEEDPGPVCDGSCGNDTQPDRFYNWTHR